MMKPRQSKIGAHALLSFVVTHIGVSPVVVARVEMRLNPLAPSPEHLVKE
jgi:hypothetical protein